MLYHIALYLQNYYCIFNLVNSVAFRAIASFFTVLLLSFSLGNFFIEASKKFFRSQARAYTPETHQSKHGTPTMGGIFIIGVTIFTVLLWSNLLDFSIWLLLGALLGFGSIGFWDDFYKIKYQKGISERKKFTAQLLIATILVLLWMFFVSPTHSICFPFFKSFCLNFGIFLVPWVVFIIVGTSNAVNLTDGLDGLAITSLLFNFVIFSVIAYLASDIDIAKYLHILPAQTSEVAIFGATLSGASIGFLWYNTYPAQIFMGDVGSLALGSVLGFLAVMTRQELLLPITGGIFVVETLSVIIQVFSYKIFKRKIFKMAPIHHHFELIGWPEAKITVRFGIITFILCIFALIIFKI